MSLEPFCLLTNRTNGVAHNDGRLQAAKWKNKGRGSNQISQATALQRQLRSLMPYPPLSPPRDGKPTPAQCWANVGDVGPALSQRCDGSSSLPGYSPCPGRHKDTKVLPQKSTLLFLDARIKHVKHQKEICDSALTESECKI